MSWRVIAEKDVRDAIRDNTLVWNIIFVSLFGAILSYNHAQLAGSSRLTTDLATLFTLVVPLMAVLVAHESIAYERATDRIRTTLSLPHTRADIVVGTAVGRAIVVATTVWVALAIAALITIGFEAPISPRPYLGYSVATILLGAAVATITVGISAAVRSTTLSLVFAATLVLVALGWPVILEYGWFIATNDPTPTWLTTIGGLDPIRGYAKIAVMFSGTELPPLGTDDSPIGALVLGGWTAAVLWVGYHRFEHTDL